jgi:tetratricopeptide (TPR) repeat protein
MLRAALAVLLVTSVGSVGSAQKSEPYFELTRQYLTEPAAAIAALLKLPTSAINAGVRACTDTEVPPPPARKLCSPPSLKSAALLHADAANALMDEDVVRAGFHIRIGSHLLRPLRSDSQVEFYKSTPRDDLFIARWYAYMARAYVAHGYRTQAMFVVEEGLRKCPASPDLRVARGVIIEIGSEGRIARFGESAADDYRRALVSDPSHRPARLRLGWAHYVELDDRAAADLTSALGDEAEPEIRYLAHLFLGRIAERDRHLPVAIAEYEAARAAAPQFQSACVALSNAYSLAGDLPRARTASIECLTLESNDENPDPWWMFDAGLLDVTTTKWVHEEVQRQ